MACEKYLDPLSPEERAADLRDVAGSTRHMAAQMEEVLLLGRVEAGRMEFTPAPLDLVEFCAELADELRSSTGGACPIELQQADSPAHRCKAMRGCSATFSRTCSRTP